jgi:hypothetical protein
MAGDRGRRARVVAVSATVLAVVGCGGSKSATHSAHHRPTVCATVAADAMARFIAVPAHAITTARSTGNNAMPQCQFTARMGAGRHVGVLANVDSAPSPYFRLERTIVESSQIFGPTRLSPAPVSVAGLGLEASWFPANGWLMATDGFRLITTSVNWRGASRSQDIALAEAVTRTYLRTPRGKAAQAVAKGFPSNG